MARRQMAVFGAVLAGLGSACSLVVSLDGLSDGNADAPDAGDATTVDAPLEAAPPGDAGIADAASALDSAIFRDDFERPDDTTIGNNWFERNSAAFFLEAGTVVRNGGDNKTFQDNVVYRPPSEDLADVEVTLEFKLTGAPGFPQVEARIQHDSVIVGGAMTSYGLAVQGVPDDAVLFRTNGFATQVLRNIAIGPQLNGGTAYRLRLRVTGAHPVNLTGTVEVKNNEGSFTSIAVGTYADDGDDAGTRIDLPGSVGFSAGQPDPAGLYSYDNFTRAPL